MIQRIIPVVIGITLLISGCAKTQEQQGPEDFGMGATMLKIANLPSPISDGSSLFITVDGKDAGQLPVGEAMLLQVPAGEHQVAGYARSFIGHVTIPGLTVTTSADQPRFVAYRVARNTPLFTLRGIDPLPQSAPLPKKQVSQSESVPLPQIIQLKPESAPENVQPESSEDGKPVTPQEAPKVSESENSTPVAPAEKSDASATVVSPPMVNEDALWAPAISQATDKPKETETKVVETPAP